MPTYMLSMQQPDGVPPPPEILEPIMAALETFNDDLREAGAWLFTVGLHAAASATVVRNDGERALITDGPYIEGTEHIGGFWLIEADDLDAALRWADRAALAATLPIEVRPVQALMT